MCCSNYCSRSQNIGRYKGLGVFAKPITRCAKTIAEHLQQYAVMYQ